MQGGLLSYYGKILTLFSFVVLMKIFAFIVVLAFFLAVFKKFPQTTYSVHFFIKHVLVTII